MAAGTDNVDDIPEALRETLRPFIGELQERCGVTGDRLTLALIRTLAVGPFLRRTFAKQAPSLLAELSLPFDPDRALADFVAEMAPADIDTDTVKRRLRRFRHAFLFRLIDDEVNGRHTTERTIIALSRLAETAVQIAMEHARRRLEPRFGTLRAATGDAIPLVVLGMGKLGGGELNFSSDIDLIFLYPEDGESDGRKSVSAQEYCIRWSQQLVAMLDETTSDGFVFRVDTRLRPFGDSGPPVTSFRALEEYLQKHGRAWERYAYVKARVVNDDLPVATRDELEDKLIAPFVYRRYLDFGLIESLRDMHARINAAKGGLSRDVKLGRGGIREIEFIVQSIQLLRGGQEPDCRERHLLAALAHLSGSRELSADEASSLSEAYVFLRKLENSIQAYDDRQTHALPDDDAARAALAFAMDAPDWPTVEQMLDCHRAAVKVVFRRVARHEADDDADPAYSSLWQQRAAAQAWHDQLPAVAGRDALVTHIVEFREWVDRQHCDGEALDRLAGFMPTLIELAVVRPEPEIIVERVTALLRQVLRRSAYIALLNENRRAAERMCDLIGESRLLAERLAQHPGLLDEFLEAEALDRAPTKDELLAELDDTLSAIDPEDPEALTNALAAFRQAQTFRIAVADIGGSLPLMRVSDALTWLAEALLEKSLQIAMADTVRRHGRPTYREGERTVEAGFGVVAYGKLGGLELSYGSDLDLVFLHDSSADTAMTDGDKPVENAVFFARVVRRLTHLLTTRTVSGAMYEIDTRLRPSGRSGLLVTSLAAFERYQREDAWTWEHQALLRARPVAGSAAVGKRFDDIRQKTLSGFVRRDTLAAEVVRMRRRMRQELDRSGRDRFDLKHGAGGLGDIEFLVQYLVLKHAPKAPSLLTYPDNIRQLDALADSGVLPAEQCERLQDAYRAYRMTLHRLSLNALDRMVEPDAFQEERDYVTARWDDAFGGVVDADE